MAKRGAGVNTKKISRLERHTYMDENGEVKQDSKIETFSIPAEPPYVKLYIADIAMIHGLSKSQNAFTIGNADWMGWVCVCIKN